MFQHRTLDHFLSALAARTPTPGGGAASAWAGATGAAQAAMCAAYTTGPDRFAAVEGEARKLDLLFRAASQRFVDLMELDAEAYGALVQARSLPRDTPERKKQRQAALLAAEERIVVVPEKTLSLLQEQLELLERLAHIGNQNLIADVAVAGYLFRAAASGMALQAQANLARHPEQACARERRERIAAQLKDCLESAASVEQLVLQKLGMNPRG